MGRDIVTCSQCKFWKITVLSDDDWGRSIPQLGTCMKLKQFWDCFEWVKGDDTYTTKERKPECEDMLAFVEDGSCYHAELLTLPEFFCAHGQTPDATPDATHQKDHSK